MARKLNQAERDRLHGQGLPANLDSERLARRIAQRTATRYQTRTAVLAAGYDPVAGAADLYRKAHALWALRPAEDGEGYVLVRQREEQAPDMRTAQLDAADLYDAHELMHGREPEHGGGPMTDEVRDLMGDDDSDADDMDDDEPEFKLGQRVAMVYRGQLADVIIVHMNQPAESADVVVEATDEHVHDVPMEQLMPSCAEPMEAEAESDTVIELVPLLGGGGEDPFEVMVEPSSKQADQNVDYQQGSALGHETDIGNLIEVSQQFAPLLYGGEVVLPAGRLFEMSGQSPGTPESDQIVGMDGDNPLYPEGEDNPAKFIRLRMRDDESGAEVFVLPGEFERFMDARGEFPRKPVPHRDRTGEDPKLREPTPAEGRAPTELTPLPVSDDMIEEEMTTQDLGRADTVTMRRKPPELPKDAQVQQPAPIPVQVGGQTLEPVEGDRNDAIAALQKILGETNDPTTQQAVQEALALLQSAPR